MASVLEILLPRQAPLPPQPTPEILAYNNAPQILSITGAFFAMAAVVVLLRCYVRIAMLKTFGADDYVMGFAMILNAATFVCFKLRTDYGLGRHIVVLYMNPTNVLKFMKVQYVQALIMMVGISTVKMSIALTLLRLANQKTYSRILWGALIFIVLMTLGCGGSLVWQCLPVAAAWDYSLRPPPFGTGNARCYNTDVFKSLGLMNSILNILTDVLFALLPVPLIWQLQLNMRTKISLIAILSLGWFACAAAIAKSVLQARVFDDPDWSTHDNFNILGMVEFSIGIIASSSTALKPLFKNFLDTARAMTSGTRSRTGGRVKGSKSMGYSKTADGYSQEIGMHSMSKHGSSSTHPNSSEKSPYHVAVSTRPTGLADRDAWEAHRNNSDESIHPLQPGRDPGSGGIVRTQEFTVR
ncbi:hypothetical protein BDU57DRAFT_238510 [Ampelomyces quisqualis]|uniref:Rhodopsin domain-containing protein n=1 Tax=Ampelomyces quisqualis TaxID=50730 RepID=A0A6A5QLY6_AMPQU|nr:hypothetical protein BDU57DRAFT_238510 [Ampelomyces quisqualis]